MEVTDFTTQDGRGQLQKLRRLLAQAVTQSRGNTAKVNWLNALLTVAIVDVTADAVLSRDSTDTDSLSNNTTPGLSP